MGTATLAGQRHRRGVEWIVKGLGCEGSRVQIPGELLCLKLSVSNEARPKHQV